VLAVGLVACDETFEAPPKPDLWKRPYDLGLVIPEEDFAVPLDLSANEDMTATRDRDMAMPLSDMATSD
jgi:hypothetical protein